MSSQTAPWHMTFDTAADAAYLYIEWPIAPGSVARTESIDPSEIQGMINVDVGHDGRILGVEVIDARRFLSPALLARVDPIRGRAPLTATYDAAANAVYVDLEQPSPAARTLSLLDCDLEHTIHFDFERDGRMIGIEILDARRHLSQAVLARAGRGGH